MLQELFTTEAAHPDELEGAYVPAELQAQFAVFLRAHLPEGATHWHHAVDFENAAWKWFHVMPGSQRFNIQQTPEGPYICGTYGPGWVSWTAGDLGGAARDSLYIAVTAD